MKGQVVKWQSDEILPKLLFTITVALTRVVAGSIACYSDNKWTLFERNLVKFHLERACNVGCFFEAQVSLPRSSYWSSAVRALAKQSVEWDINTARCLATFIPLFIRFQLSYLMLQEWTKPGPSRKWVSSNVAKVNEWNPSSSTRLVGFVKSNT